MNDERATGGVGPNRAATILEGARSLAGVVKDRAADIERGRRLPPALVEAMASAGLFRLCVPESLGGAEVDPGTMVRAIEQIARADGSAGWCLMIGATSGVVSAYLPEDAAREIYADPGRVTGGVFAPHGKATRVGGGYRARGRWPFASGCQHCAWLMGGCTIRGAGSERQPEGAPPESRMLLFPAADVEIIDTWSVSGLCGTGSHDISVADVFVPEARSLSLTRDRPREPGPLYLFPVFGLLALGIAAVATGIARAAIDDLVALAAAKTPTAGRRRLAERGVVQAQVARAEADLGAARAFLFEAIGAAWEAAKGRGAIGVTERARLRLAATHATAAAAGVVDSMYDAGGGTSVYASSPLQRRFRDVHVATQHMMVAPATYELTGRVLLGLDTDTSML